MHIPWDSFFARYRPLARNLAAGVLGRRDEADDIVQEALIALVSAERLDEQRFESLEHARNYFLASVRNLALKSRERTIPMQALSEQHEIDTASTCDDPIAHLIEERREALDLAIAALTTEERELVRRRFVQRETLASIAAELDLPVSTVHSREKALLERLRRAVAGPRDSSRGSSPDASPRAALRSTEKDP